MTESPSNEGARPALEVSKAEEDMIMSIREWAGHDDYYLLIQHRGNAWDITLSLAPHDPDHRARGTGATFDQAWDDMDPTWV